MEKDQETKGDNRHYTTLFRQYDPRLGRWFSLDPKGRPFETHYSSMSGNPIWFCDPLGDRIIIKHKEAKRDRHGNLKTKRNGEIKYRNVKTVYKPGMEPNEDMDSYGKEVIQSLNHLIDIGAGEDIKQIANDTKNDVKILSQDLGRTPYFNGKKSKKIYYNPASGMRILDDEGNKTDKVVTPAELLGHEFKHAHNYIYDYEKWKQRRGTKDTHWDNKEEEYTITNYDNVYWKYPRTNHDGEEEIFLSPIDHEATMTNFRNRYKLIFEY